MEDREEIYNHFPNRTTGSVDQKIKMLKNNKKKFEEEIIRLLIGEEGKKPKTKLKL